MTIDEIKDIISNVSKHLDDINCNSIMCRDCPCGTINGDICRLKFLKADIKSMVERGSDV